MDNVVVDLINERMNRLEEKVDMILSFKWQIVGASIALSVVLTTAINVAAILISKGG